MGELFSFFGAIVLVLFLMIPLGIVARGCNWIDRAATVVSKEVDPAYLLKKYEWFKDASATLDKKQADIAVYEARLSSMVKAYEGVPRYKWPRDERESMSLRESEIAGIKASFNQVAAEYNAQMSKMNWKFTNVGNLPQGANEPLPREYKPYEAQ